MSKKLIIGNWKLNPEKIAQARVLASRIEHGMVFVDRKKVEAVVCPPHVFMTAVKISTHFVRLGAQNVSAEEKGAFTGEVSAEQLKEFDVKYVLVGHSERRDMGETDDLINRKIKRLLEAGIQPVLCVGHGTKRSDSKTVIKKKISAQMKMALESHKKATSKIIACYEPVWAISKGNSSHKPASVEDAVEMCEFLKKKYKVGRVIYGGSVHDKNARSFAMAGIDGALPGAASLDEEKFLAIVKAFSK